MILKLIPRALVVCCALATYSVSALAQTSDTRHKPIIQIAQLGDPSAVGDDDPIIVAEAELASAGEELKPTKSLLINSALGLARFQPLLSAAIDQRLGSPYHWGSTGPRRFRLFWFCVEYSSTSAE